MNYAAMLALLAALAFSLPFLVRLAENVGVPRGFGIITTLLGAFFLIVWLIIRERVHEHEERERKIEEIKGQIAERPGDPKAFYSSGDYLVDLLLRQGRQREALACLKRHKQIAGAVGAEVTGIERAIVDLKQELGELEDEGASV